MCTLGGGECDAELFEDRDSWFEHELKEHRSQYSCILCKSGGFSIVALQAHILKAHGNFSDAQIKILQEEGRENPTRYEARSCPFCDDWAEILLQKTKSGIQSLDSMQGILVNHSRFKRHVASHQEQLAIFALPRAKEDERLSASGSIIGSTDMAMDEDEWQGNDVEGDNIFEQNTEDTPSDASGGPSTTSKDGTLNKQEKNASTEVEHNQETQSIDTMNNSSRGLVRSSSWDVSIPRNQEAMPINYAEFQQQYKRSVIYYWTCVCIITNPSK